jgi:hypothetical protein
MKRTPEEKLLNPKPGSKIAAARDYGIDLTLLAANLRLSPEERLRKLQSAMNSCDKLAKEVRRSRRRSQ